MNTARAQKISTLQNKAKWYRDKISTGNKVPGFTPWQLGIVAGRLETSSKLLEEDLYSSNARTAINDSIGGFFELSEKWGDSEASDYICLEIKHLRVIDGFLAGGGELSFADSIYSAFAEARYQSSYPEALPGSLDPTTNLSTGLKILARANPDWVRFVFSVFPYEKTLKPLSPEDISKGIMAIVRPGMRTINLTALKEDPKKHSLPDRLAVDEAAVFLAKVYEKLMFGTYLNGFFVYPVFTELCFPFEADLTKAVEKMEFAKSDVRSICSPQGNEGKIRTTSADYFNILRAVLRQADTALHVGFHYRSRLLSGIDDPFNNQMIWGDNLRKGKEFAFAAEEMLSFSHIFEPTSLGNAYIMAEQNFLETLKAGIEASSEDLKNV